MSINTLQTSHKKVIAFDIGIKNLAFCVLENYTCLRALENCNILDPLFGFNKFYLDPK